jgi:lambda family phage portal protein
MTMYDLGEYQDYEMIGAKLAAAFGVFIKSPFSDPYQASGYTQTAGNDDSKLEYIEPGRIERLLPGEEVQVADHQRPGQTYHPFVQTTLRSGAAGIGLSYESFSGDYSNSTYSSARSALLEERRKYRKIQKTVCDQFNTPTWQKFIAYSAMSGLLPVPSGGYSSAPSRYWSVTWECPGWEWVDPMKDSAAAEKELSIGVTTRSRILAAKGQSVDDVFQQLAREQRLADELGIDITPEKKVAATTDQGGGNLPTDQTDTGA